MTEWSQVRLGEVIELKRGYDLPKRARADGPFPIVSSSGISGNHAEAKVRGPGVVTGRYGTLGQVFYVASDFWPLNTSLYVRDFKGNNKRFVALLLESMDLAQHDGAAAVPGLNRNQLHTLPVRIPDRAGQDKIALILESIDDLIENNRRRMEVSEEISRAIYREWFVHFRYPGHEDIPLVDSPLGPIPDGWAAVQWGDVAELDYGKALRGYKDSTGEFPVFGTNGQIGMHETSLFPSGVVVGRKGAYRGIHYSAEPCWVIDTAFYLRILDRARVDPLYAYHQLRSVDLDSVDSGSAIPSTSRPAFYAIPLVVPDPDVMRRFTNVAGVALAEHRALARSSQALATLRDRLLPRLVTGQIDVSRLDLDDLVEVASA